MQHIGIDDAIQAGGGGIEHEYHTGDQRADLIGQADLSAQHLHDGGCGRHLGRHRAHHGEGDHQGQEQLGGFAEAHFKELRDGGDVVLDADIRDPAGNSRKDHHSQEIGDGRHDSLEAAGVCHARPAHQAASANDSGADGSHEHQRAEGPTGNIVILTVFDTPDGVDADADHGEQIYGNDDQVPHADFGMIH